MSTDCMPSDDDAPLLADYVATLQRPTSRRAAVANLPAHLRDQIEASALQDNGPGSAVIHRWLVDECGIDISGGAVEYWVQQHRRLNGWTNAKPTT